ncbi:MAG: hypothetical protein LQ346_006503 [Caloplaca aetnensis]|nr:MAG: hypothetical protein LQ346_006503 [Caloplaca aetnensis]
MEHDRSAGNPNSHGVDVDGMELDNTENCATDANDSNMLESADSFIVSPEAQERHQPGGHNLSNQSNKNIRIYHDHDWRSFVAFNLAALQELVDQWDTSGFYLVDERLKEAEDRADKTKICLTKATDAIKKMQQDIDKVSLGLSRMDIGDDNPAHSGPEAAKHESEDEVELGHSFAAAAPPSQTYDQLVSVYQTVKNDISGIKQTMAEDSGWYKREMKRFLPPLEALEIITKTHEDEIHTTRQDLDRINQSMRDLEGKIGDTAGRLDVQERRCPLTQRVEGLEGRASGAEQSLTRSCDAVKEAWTAALDEFKRHVANKFELSLARSNNDREAWTGRIDELTRHVATQLEQGSAGSNNRQEEWSRRFEEHKRDVITRFGEASAWLENTQGAWTRKFAGLERDTGSRFEQQGLEITAQLRNIPAMLRAEFESGLSRAMQNAYQLSRADLNALKTVLEEVCSGHVESGLSCAIQNAYQLSQADLNALKTALEEVRSGHVESGLSRRISQASVSARDRINAVDARLSRIAEMEDQSGLSQAIATTQRETQHVRAVMDRRASLDRPLRDRVIRSGRGGDIRLWKVLRVVRLPLPRCDLHIVDPARLSAPRSQGFDAVGII